MDKKQIGNKGEDTAVNYLFANGYDVIHRNYRLGRAEIDIIAQIDNTLVFVEVKTRKDNTYGYPEEFVTDAQQERIWQVAEEYVEKTAWQGQLRFDIIAIVWDGPEPTLDHFEDAF
ncbi:MAG: YraN family protein [Bacteroidota bacterium]